MIHVDLMSVFSCKVKYIEVLIASKKLAFALYCFNKLDIMPIITLIEYSKLTNQCDLRHPIIVLFLRLLLFSNPL